MEKLLVVTYNDDMSQFEMFCHCINLNWQGNQFLTVVVGTPNPDTDNGLTLHCVNNIIKTMLPEWTVEVINGSILGIDGYLEQCINKIIYSIDERFRDVIVFDSKDFLLKSSDSNDFKNEQGYRATFIYPAQTHLDLYPDGHALVDGDISEVPASLNLTPWIWSVSQLQRYWNYMQDRFGNYTSWKKFPAGQEIDTFFAYTWLDTDATMRYLPAESTPLLVGGNWSLQTYTRSVNEASDFKKFDDRKIWKHSRKSSPECLQVTRQLLVDYGIKEEIIDRVFG